MDKEFHILMLEDNPTDAELAERELRKAKLAFSLKRVETEEDFLKELKNLAPDLILSDYKLPSYDGLSALAAARENCPVVPFIFISGEIGEELAIETLKGGATDYVLKHRLSRLVPAVNRALREAEERAERRQAEESLRVSEERYRALYEDNPSTYFTVDTKGTVLSVNQFGAVQLGYTTKELIGQPVLNVFYEDDKKAVLEQLSVCLRNPGQIFQWEFRKVCKNGSILWVRESARAIPDVVGSPVVFIVCEDITDRKQAEEKIQLYTERLQNLSSQLIKVQEIERRHIAHELHDEIGQVLTAVKINLQAIQGLSKDRQYAPSLKESIVTIDRALQQVRNLSLDLRPSMLDDLGLVSTLRWYMDRQMRQAGLHAKLIAKPSQIHLPLGLETICFRIVQEALTNVVRHAKAKHAHVELQQRDTKLELIIRDDGIGFNVRTAQKRASRGVSFGLLGMQERVRLAGGEIEIKSKPNHGTMIRARFPLASSLSKGKRVKRKSL